jgi:hypothetical protein
MDHEASEAPSEREAPSEALGKTLDPMERISEILFGVIMTLTFTCALAVATADNLQVRTMLVAALGCNLAWGLIDAGVYVLARVYDNGRKITTLRAFREAVGSASARRIIADELSPLLAATLSDTQLEAMQGTLRRMPMPVGGPRLMRSDWIAALWVGLLCFVSTFPIALPFIVIGDARTALRASNVVAAIMLALCGYAFGRHSGLRPWVTALTMVAFGAATVAIAIALGG